MPPAFLGAPKMAPALPRLCYCSGGLVPDLHHILAKASVRADCTGQQAWQEEVHSRLTSTRCLSVNLCQATLLQGPRSCLAPPGHEVAILARPTHTRRVAASSATPLPPRPRPSCAACTKPSRWHSLPKRRVAPATMAAAQVTASWRRRRREALSVERRMGRCRRGQGALMTLWRDGALLM